MLTAPSCRLVPVVLSVLLLASCNRDAELDSPTLPIDSAGVRIVESDPSSSDATCTIGDEPSVVIGDDETDERQWFSSIPRAGRLSDGSIVAADRATGEVRIYDETGGHLRSMGGMGEGPGEFDDPYELWVTAGDTLWVGDATAPWRYNVFASEGEFFCHLAQPPGAVWEFGSDYVLLTAQTELGTQTVRLYRMHLPTG